MSEKRFLELVNLYLDKEIAGEEREELERELEADSYRKEVFDRYCRLQDAAAVASLHYGTHLASTVDFKNYHILARHSQRRIRKGFLYSAGAMAAACLTVAAALHLMESSFDYTHLPALPSETEYAAVPVEVFEARQVARAPSPAAMPRVYRTMRRGETGFSGTPVRQEDFPARSLRGSGSVPSANTFQASMRFDEANPSSSMPVLKSDSAFEASFSDFAFFQFQR